MSIENLAYTDRYEESLNSPSDRSKVKKRKAKKVTIDLDEIKSYKDLSASVESLDSLDADPSKRTARDDVLESLGYKSSRIPKPSANQAALAGGNRNLCHYCGRRVYPMERIDIGELYHRGCFKCHTCGLQLTLKTFCRVSSEKNEIFCKTHVPKLEAAYDKEAIEIQAAIRAQKKASEKVIKQYEPSPNRYDPDAIEFRRVRDLKQGAKVKRRKSLKTTADYQKFGVFEAQEELEKKHRKEEDKLYGEMYEERRSQLKNLETSLAKEKEKTVKELIAWFEEQKVSEAERTSGLKKVEQYYFEHREQRIKELLDKIHYEEQEAVTRLTDKHAQEMLLMIEQRDQQATEELGKHQPQYVKQLSYKDIQYQDGDDDDDGMIDRSEDELKEDKQSDGDDNDDDDDDDDNNDNNVTTTNNEKDIKKIDDGGNDKYGTSDKKSEENNRLIDDQLAGSTDGRSNEVCGSSAKHLVTNVDHLFPKESERRQHRHFDSDKRDVSTERKEFLTNKPKNKEIEVHSEKFSKEKKSNDDETVMVNEEMAERKNKGNIPKLDKIWKTDLKQKKTNVENVNQDFSSKEDISDTRGRKADASKHKIKKPSEVPSEKSKARPNIKVTVEKREEYEEEVDEKEEDEEEDVDEEETIEERIKKVLKKNNFELSGDSLENEKERQKERSPHAPSRKSDKNVWRDQTSGKAKEGSVKSLSSDDSKTPKKRETQKMVRGKDGLLVKHVQISSSKEKLNSSNEEEYAPQISASPSAQPPVCRKSKLYKDPEIFKEFDKHAFEEAKRDPTSFTDLVRRLSYKCENDLQKVRAIFRWITAKDLNKIEFSKDLSTNTPMGLLRGIKSGTESYHNLFKRLCSYVGIHCKIIDGLSKGVGYRPGSKFRDGRFRNQWTAVWIKDSWRFVNCNWGARHVKQFDDPHPTYKIDEFYFLTDPEDHVQQHFPDDPRWQLLRKSISVEEFVRMPVVKSPFFNNKLKFSSKVESILKTSSEGIVEICLRCPHLMSFAAKLQSKGGSVPDEHLSSRCLMRTMNDYVVFTAAPPAAGHYYWDIFVDKKWKSQSMDNACSFQIYCPQVPTQKIHSYPPVCFGRMPESEVMNFRIAPEFDPYLKVKGDTQLDLDVKNKSSIKTALSMSYFHHRESKQVDCSQYAMISSRTKTSLSCHIRCPQKGNYSLDLLITDKNDPNLSGVPVYKFFVECREPSEKTKPLPRTTSRWRDCKLIEPLERDLVVNSNVCFRIESSVALQILVSVNDTWFSLQRINDLWQGIVNTGPKVGKITILGKFKEDETKYIPFVEYIVKEPSLTEEVHALFKYMN